MPSVRLMSQIGPYRIGACVGRGGMGEVYEAEHVRLGRRRALKVLRPELFDDERLRARFIKEIAALSKVEHPNVVDILDVGDDQGQVYYAMEYLDGFTLRERAHDLGGRMTWAQIHPILLQLADALATAHAAGVIHRDLKPQNVMLIRRDGRDDYVKIVDFGIAKVLESSGSMLITGTSEFFGSVAYMSPEQAAQTKTIDARSDMYSLGSMLYELLSGNTPFVGVPVRILTQLAREPPPDLQERCPELSPEVIAFVHRLLNKEPKDRFADMAELTTALRSLAPDAVTAPTTAAAAPPIVDAPPPPPASRRSVYGLLALTVVSIVLLVFVLCEGGSTPVDVASTGEPAAPSAASMAAPESAPPQTPATNSDGQVTPPPPDPPPDSKQPDAKAPTTPTPGKQVKDPTKNPGTGKKKPPAKCGASEWAAFISAARGKCGVSWTFTINAGVENGRLVIRLTNPLIEEAGATSCVIENFRAAHSKCDLAGLGPPSDRKVR